MYSHSNLCVNLINIRPNENKTTMKTNEMYQSVSQPAVFIQQNCSKLYPRNFLLIFFWVVKKIFARKLILNPVCYCIARASTYKRMKWHVWCWFSYAFGFFFTIAAAAVGDGLAFSIKTYTKFQEEKNWKEKKNRTHF